MRNQNDHAKRFIIIKAICALIVIICLVLIANIKSIVELNYGEYEEYRNSYGLRNVHSNDWDGVDNIFYKSSRFDFDKKYLINKCRIGKIDYYCDNNLVKMGDIYMYVKDLEPEKDFGKLICSFFSNYDDSESSYYGQKIALRVYDIGDTISSLGISQDDFYRYIYDKYTNDTTTFWKGTSSYEPILAMETGPLVFVNKDVSYFQEMIVLFANERVYSFYFTNDKLKGDGKTNMFYVFDNLCNKIVNDIDLTSYQKWHYNHQRYLEYNKIVEKEEEIRELWARILYLIALVCSTVEFILSKREIGRTNQQARKLSFYCIVGFSIAILAMGIGSMIEPLDENTLVWFVLCFIPTVIIDSLMISFLTKRSNKEYNTYYLIPDWVSRYNIKSDFKKRLLLLLIIYPVFLIGPIPVVGICFLFVIIFPFLLAVEIFKFLIKEIVKVYQWLKEGRKIDKQSNHKKCNNQLYCRFCGKPIDADSEYCKYCGKKI